MLLLIEVLPEYGAVIRTAQFLGKRHNIHMLRLSLIGRHVLLRRRAGGLGTIRTFLHAAKKIKLIECLVIPDPITVHLQFQRDCLIMSVLLQFFRQLSATVNYDLVHAVTSISNH